jgi:dihydroorotate dehydrogenase (NAD+) catalytic subunit
MKTLFSSPIIASSGPWGYFSHWAQFIDLTQFGALTLKTTTFEPKVGHPYPRIFKMEDGFANRIGLENPGLKWVLDKEIPPLLAKKLPLVFSLWEGDPNLEQLVLELAKNVNSFVAIEINGSCPNVAHEKFDLEKLDARLKLITTHLKVPLWYKLAPLNVTPEVLNLFKKYQISALHCFNALPTPSGGFTSPSRKPEVIKLISEIKKTWSGNLIGGGGVTCAQDINDYLNAGCQAVGVGAGVLTHFTKMINLKKEFDNLREGL